MARPIKFLSQTGVGTPKNVSFHKFPAQYRPLCLKYSILNFRNCRPVRDIKMKKKVFSCDFRQFEQFKY